MSYSEFIEIMKAFALTNQSLAADCDLDKGSVRTFLPILVGLPLIGDFSINSLLQLQENERTGKQRFIVRKESSCQVFMKWAVLLRQDPP